MISLPGGTYNPRQQNMGYLKRYNDDYYKLVVMNSVLMPGYEGSAPKNITLVNRAERKHERKLDSSLSRSRRTVFEIAMCNQWEWFITFTISPEKHNRYDLAGTYKRLAKWINNFNVRNGVKIQYLLIPEPHKDGAWHFHGLLSGLPFAQLTPFTLEENIPWDIKKLILNGRQIYNWCAYAEAFGYATLERISDPLHCAKYMTKYITKELQHSSIELDHHVYYCSKGLQRPELIFRGDIRRELNDPDFENEYVHIKTFSSAEAAAFYFCDLEE